MQNAWGVDVASLEPSLCQVRLSLSGSGAVWPAGVAGGTNVYCHPFRGNRIALWNGTRWRRMGLSTFVSVAVPATTLTPFDVFAHVSGSSVFLETTNWTNGTTRATALAYHDGILVRSGAPTRRYLGTGCTTEDSGEIDDLPARRGLWNYYHRLPVRINKTVSGTWTYETGVFRQWNNDAANQVEVVNGISGESLLSLTAAIESVDANVALRSVSIGQNSTTSNATRVDSQAPPTSVPARHLAELRVSPNAGRRYYPALEYCNTSAGPTTWGGHSLDLSGIFGEWQC